MYHTTVRFALIPTHNRLTELRALVAQIVADVDYVVVIDNASDLVVTPDDIVAYDARASVSMLVIRDEEQPPNLSRLWNVGFDCIADIAIGCDLDRWDVAVFNDDTVLPPGWFEAVTPALRSEDNYPAIACSDAYGTLTAPVLHTVPDRNLSQRMCPWAFIIRGELGLRADENLRWWWGDTDLDWQARAAGGVGIIPGYTTRNTCANSSTVGELAEQSGRDGETFARKWGY